MAWSVRQSAVADSEDPVVTLGTTPLQGSLLIAIAVERSGGGVASMTMSSSGWTSRATRDVLLTNGDYRQSIEVWDKIAGASESTGVSVTTSASITARLLVVELQTDNGDTPAFEAFIGTDSGASAPGFLSTGDIAVDATDLAIAVFGIKNGNPPPSSDGVEHEIDSNVVNSSGGTFGRHIVFAAEVFGSAANVDAQYFQSAGNNSGIVALLLRYGITAAGGGAFELDAQPGSFTLTGSSATTLSQRVINAQTGAFALTGAVAGLFKSYTLDAQPGSFTFTGEEIGAIANRLLNAEPGSFTLTGVAAELVYTPEAGAFELNAEAGTFALTGFEAGTLAARAINAAAGSFTISGEDAAVLAGRLLVASPGSYTLTGTEAQLLAGRILSALPGSFEVDGQNANLVFSGEAEVTDSGRIVLHLRFGPYM